MAFSDPEKNISQFLLGEGMNVADLGAGPGLHAISAARAVGEEGRVYAVDIQKNLLEKLKTDAGMAGIGNIEVIWGDLEVPEGSKIGSGSMDAVMLVNILFQVEDHKALIKEAARILRSQGKVLVVDWSHSYSGMGPQESDIIKEGRVKELMGEAGFAEEKSIDAGEHHYGYIFRKN